jgi:hypothetical protein
MIKLAIKIAFGIAEIRIDGPDLLGRLHADCIYFPHDGLEIGDVTAFIELKAPTTAMQDYPSGHLLPQENLVQNGIRLHILCTDMQGSKTNAGKD